MVSRQESIHRLPQWKQEPEVNSFCLRDCLNGCPRHFHPIGVQERHRTMGTPVRVTAPLPEKGIGVIVNNRDLLGAVRELLSHAF